jgi:hypothetical protein
MTGNTVFDCEICCDASDVGFGGFVNSDLDSHLENIETFGNWTESESLESSSWRELECVKRAIYTFSNELENKQVKINSDNKNIEHILKVGSKKTTLQKTATQIHSLRITKYSVDSLLDSKNTKRSR